MRELRGRRDKKMKDRRKNVIRNSGRTRLLKKCTRKKKNTMKNNR